MTKTVHFQQTYPVAAATLFAALVEPRALETWFAEHAAVSLPENEYCFWGRYTPETPDRAGGTHVIEKLVAGRRLRYRWSLRGGESTVDFRLSEKNGSTILAVWHSDIPAVEWREPGCYSFEDLWCVWLDHLRRYLDGKPIARCDFSTIAPGDVTLALDIRGEAEDVWSALVDPQQRNRVISNDATEPATEGSIWVDWGEEAGALVVRNIEPKRRLELEWVIEGVPTVVTWTLDNRGGRTRLTLAHSGFGPDVRTDGEWAGWASYLNWIQSLVEYGSEWMPPIKDVAGTPRLYHSAAVLARQGELIGDGDPAWE